MPDLATYVCYVVRDVMMQPLGVEFMPLQQDDEEFVLLEAVEQPSIYDRCVGYVKRFLKSICI